MRALFSYGVAMLIALGIAAWLATGTLVVGGRGPGNGETPIVELIDGEHHGPVATALEPMGVLAEHETEHAVDPAMTIAQRNEKTTGADVPARSVRTMTSKVRQMAIEVPLRGRTKARSAVTAVAETPGIVDSVHVTKGQKVAPGDLLCTLDQGTRQAAVAQAEAAVAQAEAAQAQAQADFETNAQLRKQELAPANTARQFEVALRGAESAVIAAQSGLDNAKAELERTEIHAEVAGVIQDPLATQGSMLAMGTPCAAIVQLDPMLFIAQVPEARVGLARIGLEAKVSTITGETVTGKVSYIASTADEATRSFGIEIELPNAAGRLRDGTTAEAIVNLGSAPAHLLPQSVLTLDDEGVLGVRAVEDSKVVFHPVNILKDSREGIWVTGLPPTADIITVGQEFVQVGQVVDATPADGPVTNQEPPKQEPEETAAAAGDH